MSLSDGTLAAETALVACPRRLLAIASSFGAGTVYSYLRRPGNNFQEPVTELAPRQPSVSR